MPALTTVPVINRLYSEATITLQGNQDMITFYHGLKQNAVAITPDLFDIEIVTLPIVAGPAEGGMPIFIHTATTTTTITWRARGMRNGDSCTIRCKAWMNDTAGNAGSTHVGKLTGTDLTTTAASATVTSASGGFLTNCSVGDVVVINEPGNAATYSNNGVYTIASITNATTMILSAVMTANYALNDFVVEGPGIAVNRSDWVAGAAGTFIQIPFHLPAAAAYAGGVVTGLDAELPGTEIEAAEILANTITAGQIAPNTITNAQIDAAAAIAGSKISPDVTDVTIGLAAGYAIARGQATVPLATGTLDVATGLNAIVAAVATMAEDPVVGTHQWLSQTWAGATLTLKCWKATAINDVTPIAATDDVTVDWIAIGTLP